MAVTQQQTAGLSASGFPSSYPRSFREDVFTGRGTCFERWLEWIVAIFVTVGLILNAFKRYLTKGFPGGSVVKNLPANAADAGSIPGLGRSPGEGNGNPLQYSCLENTMDGGA